MYEDYFNFDHLYRRKKLGICREIIHYIPKIARRVSVTQVIIVDE